MIAGLILTDSEQKECHLGFLGDETEVFSLQKNEEIARKIVEKEPEIVAVNSGSENIKEELTDQEEELKEEGFAFTPASTETRKVRRLQALKAEISSQLEVNPKFIRFDPKITSEKLAIHDDSALQSLGVETPDINSAGQFDAMLGAVTARFYQQDQYRDLGIIVPQNLESEDE